MLCLRGRASLLLIDYGSYARKLSSSIEWQKMKEEKYGLSEAIRIRHFH
jgi:hypothetical protein